MIRLLLVDDEPSAIKVIRAFTDFDGLGMELVGEARNGIEAMDYVNAANPPDILITDMEMPMMNGVSLLNYLSDVHPEICIIVASSYYDFRYTHAAIRAKAVEYLLKPIDRTELNRTLKKCCDKIREQRKIVSAQSVSKVRVSLPVYQQVLSFAKQLSDAMEYDSSSLFREVYRKFRDMAASSADEEEGVAQLARDIFTDSLRHYCIEKGYDTLQPQIPKSRQTTPEEIYDSLERMYEKTLEELILLRSQRSTDAILADVDRFIRGHYREALHLEAIAEEFRINKEYLANLYKKKFGVTVGAQISSLKIQEAKRQLIYTDISMEQIAETLGYNNANYFFRQFKKETGMSPGKFRKEYRSSIL